MADYDEGYEYEEEYSDDNAITPEDCWTVIGSYFKKKGLVSQQIDSFNDFQETTIQELVEEYSQISVDEPHPPSGDDRTMRLRRYDLNSVM